MPSRSSVTFHTAPPAKIRLAYQNPPYREVIGFSSHGSDLWTPRAGKGYRSEKYSIDSAFAKTLRAFFEAWLNNPDLAWNCHMAAAGMRGLVNWNDEPTARKYARDIWLENSSRARKSYQLAEGKQGVYAGAHRPEHSVVGLSPDEYIQLNETNGKYASIAPAKYIHSYFLRQSGVNFYTS